MNEWDGFFYFLFLIYLVKYIEIIIMIIRVQSKGVCVCIIYALHLPHHLSLFQVCSGVWSLYPKLKEEEEEEEEEDL